MRLFSRIVIKYAGLIALVGGLLALAGAYYSTLLYKNLRTDLEELLPNTARSVLDLDEVTHRLEAIDNLAILVFSQNTLQSRKFVDDLSAKLKKVPREVISSVEYKIDEELKFFKRRRTLYMDLEDIVKVRDYIQEKIEYEKSLYNPLSLFSSAQVPEPRLDLLGMKKKYDQKVSSYSRFPDGYYATPDGKKRVILVYMPGKASGVSTMHHLKESVDQAISELKPKSYAPDLEIQFTGGVQSTIEEQAALVADLELSTIIVMVIVTVAMIIFYRALRATIALVGSLLFGTFWTFGVSYFAVGYLNANSAFLGSIVIGNGINFGIIHLARYMEERRIGRNHVRAVHTAMTHTATATWTAALAAALSYGSLTLTGFRGFKQFGVIGLIGMVLCWISAFTLLPAYLTLFDRWKSLAPQSKVRPKAPLSGTVATFVSRYPKIIWASSLLMTLASLASVVRYNPNTLIETDLSKLRDKKSMTEGAGYLSKHVDEIFQRYLSPMVILPKSNEHTQKIAAILKKKKEEEGQNSLLANVQSIEDFVPKDQNQKIKVLKEIKSLLPARLMRELSPADRAEVNEFLTPEVFQTITMKDLPELVLNKFREKDGSIGRLVLVEPPISDVMLNRENLIHFIEELRETADSVAPGTPVAGGLPISADMLVAISNDGPRATLFAFIAVLVLVIFVFRNVRTISLVLFALILGVLWLGGIILSYGIKINFLNFIALPITFGIGVDYGVNIFQRYREEGIGSVVRVIRDTGGAVGLCSFTTIVGYSSLLIASNQAFVSFGMLAVIGEITCVIAAIISLPAYLILNDRKGKGEKNFA